MKAKDMMGQVYIYSARGVATHGISFSPPLHFNHTPYTHINICIYSSLSFTKSLFFFSLSLSLFDIYISTTFNSPLCNCDRHLHLGSSLHLTPLEQNPHMLFYHSTCLSVCLFVYAYALLVLVVVI